MTSSLACSGLVLETNIAAIGHRQITRLAFPTQDVVPGIRGALNNDEPGTATACMPSPALDVESNVKPASTSAGLPSSFADEKDEVSRKSKKVRNIKNVQNYITTESIRKSSNINLSWTKKRVPE